MHRRGQRRPAPRRCSWRPTCPTRTPSSGCSRRWRRVRHRRLPGEQRGHPDRRRIRRLDAVAFDRVLAVNLRGSFLCAQQQIRQLLERERPGSIVNISSVHQVIPKPQFLGYSVSKGGMQNLTRTLALEFAGRGIRVNAIGPGATVTPINRAWIDDPDKRGSGHQPHPHGPRRPRRGDGRRRPPSSCPTRRATSPARPSSSTAASPSTPTFAARGRRNERGAIEDTAAPRAGGRPATARTTRPARSTRSPPTGRAGCRPRPGRAGVRPRPRARRGRSRLSRPGVPAAARPARRE